MLDFQSLYKKDHQQNLRIFKDLKVLKEFSSVGNDLKNAFGDNSYKNFHKNLIEQKHFITNNYMDAFQKQDNKKNNGQNKLFENRFNIKLFEQSLENMKIKDQILTDRIRFPYIERMKNSPTYLLRKEIEKQKEARHNKSVKTFFQNVPDVGRYNPKYNSINKHSYRAFFGNIHSNRFNTIEQEIIKNDSNDNNKENEENRNKKIFTIKNKKIINNRFLLKKIIENNQEKKKNNKVDKNIENITENKNNNNISIITDNNSINNSMNNNSFIGDMLKRSRKSSSIEVDKNRSLNKSVKLKPIKDEKDENHCLRFETYTPRKPLNKVIIYNTDIKTELPNYYTSKYIKNNVNFNKSSNIPNYIEKIISLDQNPPLGFYEPKYNYVFNNIDKNIYINKNILNNLPKNNLRKIFCDYNISKDYQIVPSLNSQDEDNTIDNNDATNRSKSKNI